MSLMYIKLCLQAWSLLWVLLLLFAVFFCAPGFWYDLDQCFLNYVPQHRNSIMCLERSHDPVVRYISKMQSSLTFKVCLLTAGLIRAFCLMSSTWWISRRTMQLSALLVLLIGWSEILLNCQSTWSPSSWAEFRNVHTTAQIPQFHLCISWCFTCFEIICFPYT